MSTPTTLPITQKTTDDRPIHYGEVASNRRLIRKASTLMQLGEPLRSALVTRSRKTDEEVERDR